MALTRYRPARIRPFCFFVRKEKAVLHGTDKRRAQYRPLPVPLSSPLISGTRRPFPDDVGNVDRLGDQPKAGKAIGDDLLALDHLVVDRNDAIVGAVDEAPDG